MSENDGARTLLMGTRGGPGVDLEAEPVLVEHDDRTVTLTLDDGGELTLDRRELAASIVIPEDLERAA